MKTLLVTGGAGFIGANFVRYWSDQYPGDKLVVLDALTYAGNPASIQDLLDDGRAELIVGDICDAALVLDTLRDHDVDTLVHFAAESHVDRSIVGPEAFVRTNVLGTHCLLEAARKLWCADGTWLDGVRFHHVSTDEVYGSLTPEDPAFTETTAYAPNSPYSASKAGADHLVRAYHHTYGMPVTTSNCSNNYGPFQFPEKLIPLMIINALSGKALPVYGDGSNIRDWLFVGDHCRAIDLVIRQGAVGRVYNIGGNEEHNNLDIVNQVCDLVDEVVSDAGDDFKQRFPNARAVNGQSSRSLIEFVKDRPGHDWRYAIDPERAETELGFRPKYDFESGLRATIEWMIGNETWWRSILDDTYKDWIRKQYDER